MRLARQLARGIRALVRRRVTDVDIADEVRHYEDQAAAALVARGFSPDEARRAARIEIGNATVVREQVRAYGWENVVETFIGDVRYGVRRLRSSPGFTIVSVLTLALGIGASTAIFSAVNPILFEPLPYPHPGRIATLWDHYDDGRQLEVTFGTYRELAARSRSFSALAVMKPWRPTLTGTAEPERLEGQRVSASYFRVLGVSPQLGRGFDAKEDVVQGPNVAVISDGLWRRRFAADPTIAGRDITLGETKYLVLGVMPPRFENVLATSAEIWAPMQYDVSLPPDGREWGHHLRMIGRLADGVTQSDAQRELTAIANTPAHEYARPVWATMNHGLVVASLQDDITRSVKPALLAVLGAVILLLAIASVNVTNLLLARGAQRRGELAMRAALGADRGRMIRQLLTESVLLAACGGVVGILVAKLGVQALVALSPPGLSRVDAIRLDATTFLFAAGVTTLIGVAIGLLPALQASRSDPQSGLQQASRRSAGGHRTTRSVLVMAEVALALVLLVGSGLLLRSLQRLFAVAPGFDAAHVLTMQVQTSGARFNDDATRHAYFASVLDAVRRVPGVQSAGLTSQLPLSGDFDKWGAKFAALPANDAMAPDGVFRYAVSPQYLETMRIPLRAGRSFDARDSRTAPAVALINESLAARKFPGRSAIGERVRIGGDENAFATIVGIVADVKQTSLALDAGDAVYLPSQQWPQADFAMSLVLRIRGDAASLTSAVREAIWSVDRNQPVVRVATMDDLLARSAAERRFALTLFEAFALAALLLAATGLYGVLSGSVNERMREIGVRTALGATRRDILRLIVGEGFALTIAGALVGLGAAYLATRALETLLFEVSRVDPLTYIGVTAVVALVALIACAVPALRAARVDPSVTLRMD